MRANSTLLPPLSTRSFNLLYCGQDVLCLYSLPAGVLREIHGFLRDLRPVGLKQLRQLFRGIFAHAFGSCLPNNIGYRCFWYYSHFYHRS